MGQGRRQSLGGGDTGKGSGGGGECKGPSSQAEPSPLLRACPAPSPAAPGVVWHPRFAWRFSSPSSPPSPAPLAVFPPPPLVTPPLFGSQGWQIGHTRAFLRSGQLAHLEGIRGARLSKAAIIIQTAVRRMLCMLRFRRLAWAAQTLQSAWRGRGGRIVAGRLRRERAARKIQGAFATCLARKELKRLRRVQCAVVVQASVPPPNPCFPSTGCFLNLHPAPLLPLPSLPPPAPRRPGGGWPQSTSASGRRQTLEGVQRSGQRRQMPPSPCHHASWIQGSQGFADGFPCRRLLLQGSRRPCGASLLAGSSSGSRRRLRG